jgi:acyl-CoA synthetase (AMP-forming)/AMP-acid ligase II
MTTAESTVWQGGDLMTAREWETPRTLLEWLTAPRADRGLLVLDEAWKRVTYEALGRMVLGTSQVLQDRGTVPGDVVAVTAAEPLRFATGFFGALHAGATPLPIAPPTLLGQRYVDHVSSLLGAAPPRVVITSAASADQLRLAVDRAGVTAEVVVHTPVVEQARAGDRPTVALLQFTSGSTGQPRPVEVSWTNLEANVNLIRRWLELTADDSVASWLPLYHDMGLIGTFITAVCSEMDAWIMRPEQFVMKPRIWLECFGTHGVTIASAPNFGYSYTARRVRPASIEGFDFSRWRVAIIGAERLDPAALRRFLHLAEPFGFRTETFRPAYGLAEATLAVTGEPLRHEPHTVSIDWGALRMDAPVTVRHRRPLHVDRDDDAGVLLSCGRPLDPQQVTVVDADQRPLPEESLGEIMVEGPCVASGYRTAAHADSTRLDEGRLLTGDAGFFSDGHLFVLGRMVDSFKVHGRQVYAEAVEAKIAAVAGITVDRCVVVPVQGPRGDSVVAVVEAPATAWHDPVAMLLRTEVGDALDVVVYSADRHAIPRTTSGKPRRRALRQLLADGVLRAEVVFSTVSAMTRD